MAELLLELGCEELPASFVRRAFCDLQELVEDRLKLAQIEFSREHEPLGTPRRLIVHLSGLPTMQADQSKEQRGPSIKAAYDAEGKPTPALLGFCRGQGIDPAELRSEGDYVWATKHIPGRPTLDLLAEILPEAIRSMSFDKSMRWGAARMRFARPIRWILACFDGQAVPFEIEDVRAGLESRGHRFDCPETFSAKSRAELLEGLRARRVEPEPAARETRIREDSARAGSGTPVMSDALVEENVFLTEWPTALEGSFRDEYLALPEPVLVTAMAKHERFFPVAGPDGKLLPRFISIRNGGEEATVRQGNEWVLNARFNDAKFFFDEDARHSLAEFLDKTDGILFQEGLGSVRQRADRLAALAEALAIATGADEAESAFALLAGLYCKADLGSGLVSELPSLQGQIGGEYARREGMPEEVCRAIATHYDLAKTRDPQSAADRTGLRILIADQLDKLAGYLGIGLAPSGSSDPFGLRRAAGLLIEAAWSWGSVPVGALDYRLRVAEAVRAYAKSGLDLDPVRVESSIRDLFISRYEALMPEVRHDLLDAASGHETLNPRRVRLQVAVLESLAADVPFVQTATRPINIVSAARAKGIAVPPDVQLEVFDRSALDSSEGSDLAETVLAAEQSLHQAVLSEDVGALRTALKNLEGPINRFFDSTMVMAEDPGVRNARLALLQACCQALFTAGDFSKIVVEG